MSASALFACTFVAVTVAAGALGRPSRTPRPTVAERPHPRVEARGGREWAAFLDAVASAVRAGHSLTTALWQAEQRTGISPPPPEPGTAKGDRRADPDRSVVMQALQVAAELGGPVASGLQHAANLLRERDAARAEARAHAAQARMSAAVLTLVPMAFCVAGALTSESYRQAIGDGNGASLAALGVVLNTVGWHWMRRTIRGVTT